MVVPLTETGNMVVAGRKNKKIYVGIVEFEVPLAMFPDYSL
jgi:hypothetical protein